MLATPSKSGARCLHLGHDARVVIEQHRRRGRWVPARKRRLEQSKVFVSITAELSSDSLFIYCFCLNDRSNSTRTKERKKERKKKKKKKRTIVHVRRYNREKTMRNDEKTDACHRANRNDIQALREKGRNVYKKGEKKKGKKKKKKELPFSGETWSPSVRRRQVHGNTHTQVNQLDVYMHGAEKRVCWKCSTVKR